MREEKPPPGHTDQPKGGWRRWFPFGTRALANSKAPAEAFFPANEQERLIVEQLIDLRGMDVREVMTPRVDVVALSVPVRAEDVADAVRQTGHSCFPVVQGQLDNLVGVLFVNDLFRAGRPWTFGGGKELSPLDISRRLRQPCIVPESGRVLDALAQMRKERRTFAVVVDEFGGVAGVLTVKDLLEPLVGEIRDEFDADDEPSIVPVDSRRWLIDGRTSVADVAERLGIDIPEGEYVTLGGFLFAVFGHIPEEGEELTLQDWTLRVVEMDRRRISKVVAKRLSETERKAPPPAASESAHGTKEIPPAGSSPEPASASASRR